MSVYLIDKLPNFTYQLKLKNFSVKYPAFIKDISPTKEKAEVMRFRNRRSSQIFSIKQRLYSAVNMI